MIGEVNTGTDVLHSFRRLRFFLDESSAKTPDEIFSLLSRINSTFSDKVNACPIAISLVQNEAMNCAAEMLLRRA